MKKENTSLRLKKLMSERALKQVDILKACAPYCQKYNVKMNKSDISQYVSGKVEPNQDKLFILANALNVNEAWLMGFDAPISRNVSLTSAADYNMTSRTEHTKNQQTLLNHFSKLNLKGEQEAIKRVKELTYVPDYSANPDEQLIELSNTHKTAKANDNDSSDYGCGTRHYDTIPPYDFTPIEKAASSRLIAAHNDHLYEDGELDKVQSDLAKLKNKK